MVGLLRFASSRVRGLFINDTDIFWCPQHLPRAVCWVIWVVIIWSLPKGLKICLWSTFWKGWAAFLFWIITIRHWGRWRGGSSPYCRCKWHWDFFAFLLWALSASSNKNCWFVRRRCIRVILRDRPACLAFGTAPRSSLHLWWKFWSWRCGGALYHSFLFGGRPVCRCFGVFWEGRTHLRLLLLGRCFIRGEWCDYFSFSFERRVLVALFLSLWCLQKRGIDWIFVRFGWDILRLAIGSWHLHLPNRHKFCGDRQVCSSFGWFLMELCSWCKCWARGAVGKGLVSV